MLLANELFSFSKTYYISSMSLSHVTHGSVFHKHPWIKWALLSVVVVAAIAGVSYEFYILHEKNTTLGEALRKLTEDQIATAKSLSDTITILNENLTLTKAEQDKLQKALSSEQARVRAQQQQLENISGTVGTLEKLTYTDEELLQKYSKVYFLNEHYIPTNLSRIPGELLLDPDRDLQIHTSVLPYLEKLFAANTSPDFDLRVTSAYRSYGTQANLKAEYNVVYGQGTANQFSADQGYSEHQLGTTLDFTTVRTGSNLDAFAGTSDYRWLLDNAHKYGFTLSYPEGNSYYKYEPWHWRFVGIKLATDLHNQNKHFYDLEQREIDKYLVNVFDT